MQVLAQFDRDLVAPREAREFVRSVLRQAHLEEHSEPVLLLLSELVTNAVRHGESAVGVTITLEPGFIHVAVVDHSTVPPELVRAAPYDEGGRGLFLVDAMSARWGVDRNAVGKAVWFDVEVAAA